MDKEKTLNEKLDDAMKGFCDFLKNHTGKDFTAIKLPLPDCDDEDAKEESFQRMKPAVLDVLLNTESDFFDAIQELYRKHSSCATIEDIQKLTKDILKLCK